MRMDGYGKVVAHPGIGPLLVLGFFAKIAVVAIPVVMNLGVVLGLGRGFGAAGLVIALWTAGVAVGGPLQGKLMDRYGVRRVLAGDDPGRQRLPAVAGARPDQYTRKSVCLYVNRRQESRLCAPPP
ncbi:MFS transporter [Streptomyces sp. R302]|uniref:hypothetical protein n=1 Tax=unclassified Streptomyces TaxID=2593676 RepID=UPI00145D3543|nr:MULTISPECIES: hypothetical protein [unclassified Streptomyces]NML52420.1 MFS transporter [Streptomyces sp. R301]NML82114.1 MFS transporter [Streptomyces sp. R302]